MEKTICRREFLKLAGAGFVGLALPSSFARAMASKVASKRKPNVLFISVDDLRPQLGCYGRPETISPNINRLASEGVIFTNHFVQCPACAPSRYSMLTGKRPLRSQLKSYTMQAFDLIETKYEGKPSLPHHFKLNGYYTVSIGKISHSPDGCKRGPSIKEHDAYDAGDTGEPELPFGWDEVYAPYGQWGSAWATFFAYAGGKTRIPGKTPATEAADVTDTGYPDGLIAEEALKKLRELKDKQFFLAVGFYKPHLPFNSPKRYWDAYERSKINLSDNPNVPANIDPNISLHKSYELTPRYTGLATPGVVTDDEARKLRHGYFACVHYIDSQVGKVLSELEKLGLRDNTIVMIWGDHGWHLGDYGIWGKSTLYDYALRSPLIVRAPGVSAVGKKSEELIESLDIYPTLSELCGLEVPVHLDGKSFAGLLKKSGVAGKGFACSYHKTKDYIGESMRTKQYRIARWTDLNNKEVQVELYDHKSDPDENANIAEKQPELVKKLLSQMHRINSKSSTD
jgi:arylsulfatase A-like enzyme